MNKNEYLDKLRVLQSLFVLNKNTKLFMEVTREISIIDEDFRFEIPDNYYSKFEKHLKFIDEIKGRVNEIEVGSRSGIRTVEYTHEMKALRIEQGYYHSVWEDYFKGDK